MSGRAAQGTGFLNTFRDDLWDLSLRQEAPSAPTVDTANEPRTPSRPSRPGPQNPSVLSTPDSHWQSSHVGPRATVFVSSPIGGRRRRREDEAGPGAKGQAEKLLPPAVMLFRNYHSLVYVQPCSLKSPSLFKKHTKIFMVGPVQCLRFTLN